MELIITNNYKAEKLQEEIDSIYELLDSTLPLVEELVPTYVKIYKELYEPIDSVGDVTDSDSFKKIYREISKETHPDKVSGHEDQFKRASKAYKEKNEVEMMRVYNELGHSVAIPVQPLEKELEELKSSPRYKWVRLYLDGQTEEVRQEFLKFLLNEIYVMETKNGM